MYPAWKNTRRICITFTPQIKGSFCGLNVMYHNHNSPGVLQLPWYATTSQWNAYNYATTSTGTVDKERFAGLNVHIFNPIEVFAEIYLCCLSQKCLLFSIIKENSLYSWENVCTTLENHEKHECLAQKIFPRLRYVIMTP